MSNISRRKFLKGAGVAALAVAAAGVLAGCSDQSTPDTGQKASDHAEVHGDQGRKHRQGSAL